MLQKPRTIVLISANAEWRAFNALLSSGNPDGKAPIDSAQAKGKTPFGEWLLLWVGKEPVLFMHGGWGKISASASTQYAIDHWQPELLVNLGTCGGFAGEIERGALLLVERTLVYDIIEQMEDGDEAIAHYSTALDISWLGDPLPAGMRRSLLVSADRDLVPEEVQPLKEKYHAIAGDWESGAIAWVAAQNQVPCVILRGVTDLVGGKSGEAYGDYTLFVRRTQEVFHHLLETLPFLLTSYFKQ